MLKELNDHHETILTHSEKSTSNSTVRFYKCSSTGRILAEKKVSSTAIPQQVLIREAKALQHLHGTIAPAFVELKQQGEDLILVMEKIDGQLLSDWLAHSPEYPDQKSELAKQLISTIGQLHQMEIAHLDLAPNNILLSSKGQHGLILFDFSYCAFAEELPFIRPANSFAGHINYAAPEQLGLGGNVISKASDLYALGLILAEIFGFKDHIQQTYEAAIAFRNKALDLNPVPEEWRQLIGQLLTFDASDRAKRLKRSDYSIWL